jgi:hypothetical protein
VEKRDPESIARLAAARELRRVVVDLRVVGIVRYPQDLLAALGRSYLFAAEASP